jgi:hypothetical protein
MFFPKLLLTDIDIMKKKNKKLQFSDWILDNEYDCQVSKSLSDT